MEAEFKSRKEKDFASTVANCSDKSWGNSSARKIGQFSISMVPFQIKSTYERELMEIVWAVQQWKHNFLFIPFIIWTDQSSLK